MLGSRRRDQAPPPEIVFEALTGPFRPHARPWLALLPDEVPPLLPDEVPPRVVEAKSPHLVVWSSIWPARPDDRIRFDLAPAGGGCSLQWSLETEGHAPDDRTLSHLRYRLSYLINRQLRYSFGQ